MAKLTIRQLLAAIGITNLDEEVHEAEVDDIIPPEEDSSINEQQQQTQETTPTVDPQIVALQKEIAELKAVNARLLTQTPVEHQQTADEALLDLLGIGGNDNGNESDR